MIYVITSFAQNSESDYTPLQLISYGLDAPGRMAIDSQDNNYAIQKNNEECTGDSLIITSFKSAQFT